MADVPVAKGVWRARLEVATWIIGTGVAIAMLVLALTGGEDDSRADDGPNTTTTEEGTGPDGGPTTAEGGEPTVETTDAEGIVAVLSRATGDPQAFLLDVAQGDPEPALGGRSIAGPSTTPNATLVAAAVEEEGGHVILVGPADGSQEPRTFAVEGEVTSTALAPDGRQVAFVTDAGGSEGVRILDLDSGAVRVLADGTADEADPDWSADGELIAYVRPGSRRDTIEVVRADDGTSVESFPVDAPASSPSFAPDGRSIAYIADVAGNRDVFVGALDGSEAVNRSHSPDEETGVVLLAGGWLVTSASDRGLVLVAPDGGTTQLTATPGDRV